MRRLLFLSIIILLIELLSYLGARGLFWLFRPYFPNPKTMIYVGVFMVSHVFLLGFFVGQFRFGIGYLAVLWLAALAMFITLLVILILRCLFNSLEFSSGVGIRIFGVAIFFGLIAFAVYNAYTPTVRRLSIQIDKPILQPIRIAVASDIHLGYLVGAYQLGKLTNIMQQEEVDLLLVPGDIMDDDTHAFYDRNMDIALRGLVSSVNGHLVASLGNHDLYKETERQNIIGAVRESGAILLDDKAGDFVVNGVPIVIVGRYDDHFAKRKTTAELIEGVDITRPVILLDHRPSQIDENVKLPIDLQVSGHTHNGQVFPANFIVRALNRVSYGHEFINGTHVVVSSGYGFWGVPFRLGSQAEVWVIEVKGKN